VDDLLTSCEWADKKIPHLAGHGDKEGNFPILFYNVSHAMDEGQFTGGTHPVFARQFIRGLFARLELRKRAYRQKFTNIIISISGIF
jgi:hypothetical protein